MALKELKSDHMTFLMSPKMEQLVQSFRLPKNSHDQPDFTKLNMDQYLAFRHAFVEQRMYNDVYMANKGHRAMSLILQVLCQVLCNRLPKGLVNFRTEPLANKIRLVAAPRGVEVAERVVVEKAPVTPENPTGELRTVIEKNTNERAVVRILVPKRTMTLSEIAKEREEDTMSPDRSHKEDDSERPTSPPSKEDATSNVNQSRLSRVPSERTIELDQEDKALAIANRINLQNPYMVLVMNQFAAKAHRVDFIEQLRSKVLEYFQEQPKDFKQLIELANQEAEAVDEAFIKATCDEYNMPCLDFSVHAPDHE